MLENIPQITAKDNPKIKLYKKLLTDKKTRQQERKFVIEGLRLAQEAFLYNMYNNLDSIFVTQSQLSKLSDITKNFKHTYLITDDIAKIISDTKNSQGIFGICNMNTNPVQIGDIKPNGRYIMLYNLQDPGNMGAIIRTADAFSLDGIITYNSCDIYNPKVIRSTMGSLFRVNIIDVTALEVDELFSEFLEKNIKSYAAVADSNDNVLTIEGIDFKAGGVVLIGNEGNGLPSSIINKCDNRVTIKMSGSAQSLNASIAAGIIIYQLTIDN